MRPGALLANGLRPKARVLEDGVWVDDVHPDAVLARLDRQDARQLRLRGLGGAVGAEILAGREDVLRGDEDQAAADPLFLQDTERRAGHQEVTGGVDVQRAPPILKLHEVEGRRVGHPGVGDDDVQTAVRDDRVFEGGPDTRFVGDVQAQTESAFETARLADLARHGRGFLTVEIGDDNVAPLRREPSGDGAADAVGAAGDQGHAARQLFLRRGEGQLVQLHRPVLHVEGVLEIQRAVFADPLRPARHVDRVVVDVGHDACVPRVLPGGEHPDPGDQDDARERIEARLLAGRVLLEVEVVPGRVLLQPLGDRLLERRDPLRGLQIHGGLSVHEQGPGPGVQEMIRRGGPGETELRTGLGGRELEDIVAVVEAQDDARRFGVGLAAAFEGATGQEPAQVRRDPGGDGAAPAARQSRARRRAEDSLPFRPVPGVLLGPRVHLDGRVVGLLRRLPPGDQSVLLENDAARLRLIPHRLRDLARQRESRAAVRDPDGLLSVHGFRVLPAVEGVGERQDGVRVRVIDVRVRNKSVQERLDRGARRSGLHQAMNEIRHHLLIGHRIALFERLEIVQPDAWKLLRPDRLEVRAASLDPHDTHPTPAEIALLMLDRGVAAAPYHKAGVAADQPGAVDEQVDSGEAPGFFVTPQIVHGARIIPLSMAASRGPPYIRGDARDD